MTSSLYNLALDFSKELNYTKAIMARQGDKGITVTVKPFLNGLQMDTSGGTFTLKGTTPSNRYVDSVATSVTSDEVTFSLNGTFMSEAGYYKHCYVEYRKDDQVLTTQDIIFFSLGVSDISQGQADEYVSQLEELIRKYNETFDAFMAEIKGRVDSLNKQITDLTDQAKTLQDKLDALKEEISKLGNLQVMYSNSIDFGDYDYSGNPNLLPTLNFSKLSGSASASTTPLSYVKDFGEYFEIDGSEESTEGIAKNAFVPFVTRLEKGKTYTMRVGMMIDDDFILGNFALYYSVYTKTPTPTTGRLVNVVPDEESRNKWKVYTKTFTVSQSQYDGDYAPFLQVYLPSQQIGKIKIGYDIKIEEDSTATPYQPNLLDAPYYLSKAPLGENIADPAVKFPISSSSEGIYSKNALKDFILGETYTVTIGATKPSNQLIRVYLAQQQFSDFKPVEGLVDTWVATVQIAQLGENSKGVYILQTPNASLGSCIIKWLKIEKGDTRTPNIDQYKYRGIGMRDSNNPKDYVWDLAPEYVEDNLSTADKISEITGKANNYTDNSIAAVNTNVANIADDLAKQINTNKSAAESYADTKKTEAVNESKKYTDEAITNIKPNRTSLRIESGFNDDFTGWVTFERIGDIVVVSYALSPKENSGTWKTPLPIASIPEEFRFDSSAYSTGSIATSNISNDVCQAGMNEKGLQFASWNRTSGSAQFAGQVTGTVKSREK